MKQVTLRFPSVAYIWEFIQLTKPDFLQVRIKELIVICSCSKEVTEMALKKYGAKVIEPK